MGAPAEGIALVQSHDPIANHPYLFYAGGMDGQGVRCSVRVCRCAADIQGVIDGIIFYPLFNYIITLF